MSPDSNIQSAFFDRIRKTIPANVSLVDELAEILDVSRDSAYRRMRGETVLSLDEVKKLSLHFRISVDALITPASDGIALFQYQSVDNEKFNFTSWLKSIHENLSLLKKYPDAELWYFAKDIPVFYYFNLPLLSAFKMFFWMSAVLRYDGFRNSRFGVKSVPRDLTTLGQKIFDQYTAIHRTEIWSEETLNVTLRQIEFYHDCGFFDDRRIAIQLCDEYSGLLDNIRSWAEAGFKDQRESGFDLYKNDLLIADNTILFKMGTKRMVFLPYNTMNILSTVNETFCRQTDEYLQHLVTKSEKISTTGEKQRNAFFNQMHEKIDSVKKRLG